MILFKSFSTKIYENVLLEIHGKTGLIILNRPKSLNALCAAIFQDLISSLNDFDSDDSIGAIVITGSKKAFAAGADIKEMSGLSTQECIKKNLFFEWNQILQIKKPIIGAVNGFALGGGCELAMMCDILIAGDSAKFGQPEINLGVIPGMGGTQRLVKAVGKSKAMELVLTGNFIDANEAEKYHLVSRVVPADKTVETAIELGNKISSFSQPIIAIAKEAVNKSFDLNLTEGLNFERRVFHSLFSFDDQKEGMNAFIEKRKPNFQNK